MSFRERLCSPRRPLVLMLVAALSLDVPASPAAQLAVTKPTDAEPQTAVAAISSTQLKQQLESAQRKLLDQRANLEMAIRELEVEITRLEQALKLQEKPETRKQRDKLVAQREARSKRLEFVKRTVELWKLAVERYEDQKRSEQQIAELDERTEKFAESDLPVFESEVAKRNKALQALQSSVAQTNSRIEDLDKELETSKPPDRELLEVEKWLLEAQAAAQAQEQAALQKQWDLFSKSLEVARRQLGVVAPAKTKGPTLEELQELEANHRARLAKLEQDEARNRQQYAKEQLEDVNKRLVAAEQKGENADDLKNDQEIWKRELSLADDAKRLGDLNSRSNTEQKARAELQLKLQREREKQKELPDSRARTSPDKWMKEADALRDSAEEARKQAEAEREREEAARNAIPTMQQALVTCDAELSAIRENLEENYAWDHFEQMKALLDNARSQINLLITTQKVIAYEIRQQADAFKGLAAVWETSANIWDPPVKPFLERHAKVVSAAIVVVAALVVTYILTLLGGGLVALFAIVNARTRRDISVKRFKTLQGFAQSILKIFVWIFALVTILNEFGVDPAKATGALGLIGLILAGMFQQIVIDFVKGVDIIAGRHYDVGDFVEVAGDFGHVVDFSAKYTCIRTASGEVISLPNSKCIPSRRFPDGFVDNYVDIPLADRQGRDKAKAIIDGVCRETNERIEVVKEEPRFATQFVTADGKGVILRYRVRLLPGCEWVLRDYFIPRIKQHLEDIGVSMTGEISFVLINNVERFRKLFSRQLAEKEILREAHSERAGARDEQEPEGHAGAPAVKLPVERLPAEPK
jgi:small-conductance mechanosensitive channel